jgi:nitrile hydratase accessory protein
LSPPDTPLGSLKRREGEPTFDEPWQAQALGMAETLVAAGVIAPDAWAKALDTELLKSVSVGASNDADAYYGSVLAALESLLYEAGAATANEVDRRQEQWRQAYLNTSHGQPVELAAAF